MRREYGWSPYGQRVSGSRPYRCWRTVSLLGAIRVGRRPLLMTHQGSIDGRVFLRFTKRRLCPWLRPGDIVFLDNLNIHKMRAVREAIAAVGATPIYLPTYSPELNPIELLWAHLKRALRRLALDQVPELRKAVRRLRAGVPHGHISGWFRQALRQAQCN
jgi:transposase